VYRSQRPGARVRQLRADVPEWVDDLVARCLEHGIDARPWDGAELLELLHNGEAKETMYQTANRKQHKAERAVQEATARREIVSGDQLTLHLAHDVEMPFMHIPAGEFLMGSDPKVDTDALEDEQPQQRVYLDGYWMGKTPVTNAQYAAFVKATGHQAPGHWQSSTIPSGKEHHPVVNVSWEDAAAFCTWASQVTRREVRLPTEAEWEKAARGADGRIYPWGNTNPNARRCNFALNINSTTPVERYSPHGDSPYGCADMAGNVWEWCADWFDSRYYKATPARNPLGPQKGQDRVLRGGSWNSNAKNVRSAHHYWFAPTGMYDGLGFRCVVACLPRE